MRSVIKTRQDDDMIDCTYAIYSKNEIELSWLIKLSVVCDENKTG